MSLEVNELLSGYDLDIKSQKRIRGGILIETGKEYMLFREYSKSPEILPALDEFSKEIILNGYSTIDTFCANANNELLVEYDDKKYVLMTYFNGIECNIRDEKQILTGVRELAKIHNALRCIDGSKYNFKEIHIDVMCDKRLRELRKAYAYVKNKKLKNEFELMLGNNLRPFIEDGLMAMELLRDTGVYKLASTANVCYGDYTYHNVLFNETFVGLTCWDSACLGCQLIDLYTYMRKILEKWDYDLKLGEEMLCAYLEKSQESADVRKLMAALFLYPEKLWKVVNVYFNSKKTNVFKKNMDKLNMCLAQRECKNVFAMSLLQR